MRSSVLCGVVFTGLLVFGVGTVTAQPTFDLAIAGGGDIAGNPGSVHSLELTCTMSQGGEAAGGAQGWSISIAGEGCVAITGITTDGTVAADVSQGGLRSTGFEKSETTTAAGAGSLCEGLNGAVSAVVLSFVQPITLPSDSVNEIAKVAVSATIPEEDGSGSVSYASGCQGAGQPVENTVTWDGQTVDPSFSSAEVNCLVSITCVGESPNLIFQAESLGHVGEVDAGLLSESVDDDAGISVAVPTGGTGAADVFAAIVSNNEGSDGVQGWSLSAKVSGEINIVGATTEGTASADVSQGGLRNTGFEKTEVVDPDNNDGQQGAVSAVVLSFTMPITLDAVSTASILGLSVESASAQGADAITGSITWEDGLIGAGQPVANVATVGGGSADFCAKQTLNVTFTEIEDLRNSFLRGDVNSDGKMDIADPINVVNYLFRNGPEPSCDDAADANDDSNVDVTDVMLMINHQFRAGEAPSAPFPACGRDGDSLLDDDGLSCDSGTQGCS